MHASTGRRGLSVVHAVQGLPVAAAIAASGHRSQSGLRGPRLLIRCSMLLIFCTPSDDPTTRSRRSTARVRSLAIRDSEAS